MPSHEMIGSDPAQEWHAPHNFAMDNNGHETSPIGMVMGAHEMPEAQPEVPSVTYTTYELTPVTHTIPISKDHPHPERDVAQIPSFQEVGISEEERHARYRQTIDSFQATKQQDYVERQQIANAQHVLDRIAQARKSGMPIVSALHGLEPAQITDMVMFLVGVTNDLSHDLAEHESIRQARTQEFRERERAEMAAAQREREAKIARKEALLAEQEARREEEKRARELDRERLAAQQSKESTEQDRDFVVTTAPTAEDIFERAQQPVVSGGATITSFEEAAAHTQQHESTEHAADIAAG